jgi:hypothetical protein
MGLWTACDDTQSPPKCFGISLMSCSVPFTGDNTKVGGLGPLALAHCFQLFWIRTVAIVQAALAITAAVGFVALLIGRHSVWGVRSAVAWRTSSAPLARHLTHPCSHASG